MNHYRTLGLKETAHPVEIIAAYEAFKNPDVKLDIEEELEISVAFQTLMNPRERLLHDEEILLNSAKENAPEFQQPAIRNYYYSQNEKKEDFSPLYSFVVGFFTTIAMFVALVVLF